MINTNKKSAFTLVELIVVITILAILATIAFISLQGYSADARNSKRVNDVNNIQSNMSIGMANSVPLLSYVDQVATSELSLIALGGAPAADLSTAGTYKAGKPNYNSLNVKADEFKDPNGKDYVIGASTKAGGVFEIAATLEDDASSSALVKGAYAKRAASSKTITAGNSVVGSSIITLSDSDAGSFKKGDTVTLTGPTTTATTLLKVAKDGVTLTVADEVAGAVATAIVLANPEEEGLILGTVGSGIGANIAVENESPTVLPY